MGEDGKFPEYHRGMYLGGQTRMDAAVELYKNNKLAKFIVVGGLNKDCNNIEDSEKTSSMKKYLEKECKEINVTSINSLPCTKHNFVAIFAYWEENSQEDLSKKTVGVLTNHYHLPRSLKFLSLAQKEFLLSNNPIFNPIAAESVICQPEVYIKKQEYELTSNSEVRGMGDMERGLYRDCLFRGKFDIDNPVLRDNYKKLLSKDEIRICPCENNKEQKGYTDCSHRG